MHFLVIVIPSNFQVGKYMPFKKRSCFFLSCSFNVKVATQSDVTFFFSHETK